MILFSLYMSRRIDTGAFGPKRPYHATHKQRSNSPWENAPFPAQIPKDQNAKTPNIRPTSVQQNMAPRMLPRYNSCVPSTARNASLIQGPARASIVPRNVCARWAQGCLRGRGLSRGVQLTLLLNKGPGVEGWFHMSVTGYWLHCGVG